MTKDPQDIAVLSSAKVTSCFKSNMATAVISIMLLTAILCLHLTLISGTKSEPLITITDDNWHSLLEGEWMVEL